MIPSATSAQPSLPTAAPAMNLDQNIAASAMASVIYKTLKWQKNAALVKDYLFTTLSPYVTILNLSGVPLTSELMKELAQHFKNLRAFYAFECTLDKKPTTGQELARYFSQKNIDVRVDTPSPPHPALHRFNSHIKRALNGTFGTALIPEKNAWGYQFPDLLNMLEELKLHLLQGRGDDQKSPPQVYSSSSSCSSSPAATVNQVAVAPIAALAVPASLDREARKLAKKLRLQKDKTATPAAAPTAQKDPETAAEIKAKRIARKLLEKTEREQAAKARAKALLEEQQKEEQAQIEAQKKREREATAKAERLAATEVRELAEAEAKAEAERQKEAAKLAAELAEKEARKKAAADAKAKKNYDAQLKAEVAAKQQEVQFARSFQALSLSATSVVFNSLTPNPVLLELRAFPINDAQFFQALQRTLEREPRLQTIRLPICSLDARVIKVLASYKPLRELDISLCHSIDTRSLPLLSQVTKIVCTRGGENNNLWLPFSELAYNTNYIRNHLLPAPALVKGQLYGQEEIQAFSQMTGLEYLDLDERACVDDEACTSLAKLTQLNTLYCSQATASIAGIKKLSPLVHLQNLFLMRCRQINDEACDAITSQFTDLRTFALYAGDLTDKAFDGLSRLKKLNSLFLGIFPQVTIAGYKKLVALKDSLNHLAFCYRTLDEGLLLYLMTHLDKLKFLRLTIKNDAALPLSIYNLAIARKIDLNIVPVEGDIPEVAPTPAASLKRASAPGAAQAAPLGLNQKSPAKKDK